jgi:hypothetical protein
MYLRRTRLKIRSQGIQLLAGQQARMTIACGGSRCILSRWVQKGRVDTFSIEAEVEIVTTMAICQSKSMKLERGNLSLMRAVLK